MAIALLALGATSPLKQAAIPSEFRGKWTNEPRYCDFEGDDLDSVLTVSATEVGFFENHWRVKSVKRTARGLFITYFPRKEFDMYAPNYLRLSHSEMRIFTSDDRKDIGYQRCPKGKK